MVWKIVPGDWVGVVSKHERRLNRQVHDHESLGTQLVGQNLESVCDEQARPGEGVEDSEEPHPDDLWVSRGLDILCLFELRGGDGPGEEHGYHTGGGNQEKWTSADAVDKEGTADTDNESQQGLTSVQRNLLVLVLDTHGLVDQVHVVGEESVTRVLRDDTERKEKHESVAITLGLEEINVASIGLDLELKAKSLLDFLVLKLDSCVVGISVGVEFSESSQCLVVALMGHVPSRRFWDPENECELDSCWNGLEKGKSSP